MAKRHDDKEGRGGGRRKGSPSKGSESEKAGEILGAGQGGPSRSDEPGEETIDGESKGSSARALGEGGEREGIDASSEVEEDETERKDFDIGRGQYGGQGEEGHGRGAPGAGA